MRAGESQEIATRHVWKFLEIKTHRKRPWLRIVVDSTDGFWGILPG
jgi:hypothetical protein